MGLQILKDGNFVNVTFDGATDLDLCAELNCKYVNLYYVSQNAVAVNNSLTVRMNSTAGVAIYGPFVDVTGGGNHRYFWPPRSLKVFVKGTEATSGSKATFEVEFVTE